MRILKYLFLLLLLFLLGLTVFVTTQKGEYALTVSRVINTPRANVYNYLNEYRNWETFASWIKEEPEARSSYAEKTSGEGAFYAWKGQQGQGHLQTLKVAENDSIRQKMDFNGSTSEVSWIFKDTLGKTKVSCHARGKLTAMMKIKAFFQGGIRSVMEAMYTKTLANLDRTLDYEINTYAIKVNGSTTLPGSFYIGQVINTHEDKAVKNIKILLERMWRFFGKNNLPVGGKPFVLYHQDNGDIINLSVNVPIRDSVFIMPGSEVTSGETQVITAVKATLKGDYSHLAQARLKAIAYAQKQQLQRNTAYPIREVYVKTAAQTKQPSQWVTEIYIPVHPKSAPARVYKPKDSTAVAPAALAEPAPQE